MSKIEILISKIFWNEYYNKWTVSFQWKGEVYERDYGNYDEAKQFQTDLIAKMRLSELEN